MIWPGAGSSWLIRIVVDAGDGDRRRAHRAEFAEQRAHRGLQERRRARVDAEIGRQLADLGRVQVVRRIESHHDQALVAQAVRALGQEVAQGVRGRFLRVVVQLRKDDPLGRGDRARRYRAVSRRRGLQERSKIGKGQAADTAGRDLAGGVRPVQPQHDVLQGRRRDNGARIAGRAVAGLGAHR